MSTVHVIVPNDIDDPASPSGGNRYDRRICDGLSADGWVVREHAVRGAWPRPSPTDRGRLRRLLTGLPDGAIVLVDGLVASTVPEVVAPQAGRLSLVVLLHMPVGEQSPRLWDRERRVLEAAAAVVTTSHWSRQHVLDLYGLPPHRVHAAPPGVDVARPAAGSEAGDRLLCVAAVAPHKGHDLLVAALAEVADLPWSCVCVGSLDRDPGFVDQLRGRIRAEGIGERVRLVGAVPGRELDDHYAAADLLVLASRGETYGMVVTEALARGRPVLATAVNGLPEALGHAPDGSLPGLLVPSEDVSALAGALRRWLSEPGLRRRLDESARLRRTTLTGWAVTSTLVATALSEAATNAAAMKVSADR